MKTDKIILSSLNPNDTWGGTSIRQDSKLVDAEGICICIPATHAQHQFKVLIRNSENMEEAKIEHTVLGRDWQTIVGSKQANAFSGHIDGISPCMTGAMGMGGGQIPLLTNATIEESQTEYFMEQMRGHGQNTTGLPSELKGKKFKIRKLTPRECFRLMGVDDADIDKIQAAGISNSQQYKMAGNSIVVDVLYHIFRKLLVEPGQEGNSQTLF